MNYQEISVTLNVSQVKQAVKEYVKKDFPNHHVDKVEAQPDGTVKVSIVPMGSYQSR